ncbi:glycosyl transferase, partial [Peziza echinospora]
AAIISLVRNSELAGIQQSIRQLEYRFNSNASHRYPWVFFNDVAFTQEFIDGTINLTSGGAYYETIPKEHWGLPKWVNQKRFMSSLEYLGSIGVGKGWLISYRHMCRWNSGFFFNHPRLLQFDYYWRVEPDVHFFCDIKYDVFKFMQKNGIKYGFNINILDDARSFPSLWKNTQRYLRQNPEEIHPNANYNWILRPLWEERDYNGCQFFSNFEIGDLRFFRSERYQKYFNFLDQKGGYFYERWGDAPMHTLAVALLLPPNETHWFEDIGYQHDVNRHCPPRSMAKCNCEPTEFGSGFYTLVPLESPQIRPERNCMEMWM